MQGSPAKIQGFNPFFHDLVIPSIFCLHARVRMTWFQGANSVLFVTWHFTGRMGSKVLAKKVSGRQDQRFLRLFEEGWMKNSSGRDKASYLSGMGQEIVPLLLLFSLPLPTEQFWLVIASLTRRSSPMSTIELGILDRVSCLSARSFRLAKSGEGTRSRIRKTSKKQGRQPRRAQISQ